MKIILIALFFSLSLIACKKKQPTTEAPISAPTLADYSNRLVGSFCFDNNFLDYSTTQSNLSTAGASFVSDRNGVINSAIFLDGNNSSVVIENAYDSLKLQFPFTVSLWTKLTDSATFDNRLFYSDSLDYYGYYISCGWPMGGEIQAGIGNGNQTPSNPALNRSSAHSTTQLNTNQWYHVCVVFKDIEDIDIYINGVKENVTYDGGAQALVYSPSSSFIGWQPNYSFNGNIDNVKVWNTSLPDIVIREEFLSTQ